MTEIGTSALRYCESLTSITIPNSVTKIGGAAFSDCKNITSIDIGDNVYFDTSAFTTGNPDTRLYVNTHSIAFLWLSLSSGGLVYDQRVSYDHTYNYPYSECLYDKTNRNEQVGLITTTASSLRIADLEPENYIIVSQSYKLNGVEIAPGYTLLGMNPGTKITFDYSIKYKHDESSSIVSRSATKNMSTKALVLTSLQPKVVSVGNVVVSAESNVDNEETNVGFEWRRTDWTDDFKSNTGTAYMYEGTMEGYIRNLYTGALWMVRPYYMASDGTYYYGDWMGLDPTNTSYFELTVHTYANINIEGNTALVKGYALGGTDKITVQGFKYWKAANLAPSGDLALEARKASPAIPADAQTIEAEGRVMEATLSGLDYECTYSYVAFAKTDEGTFYGEVKTFTTGPNTTGIEVVRVASSEAKAVDDKVKGIYTLTGVKLSDDAADLKTLKRGIYIVNGRKVAVK